MTLRIGNGAGFWGDDLSAPRRLVEQAELDYLTLEYLAELSMSILARQREKNPALGYAADFLEVLTSLTPALQAQAQLKIVTNAGGMNPRGCAAAAKQLLAAAGLGGTLIAAVWGDDLLPRLDELTQLGCTFAHFDTGEPLAEMMRRKGLSRVVCANAYLGAAPIVQALAEGARIVITGRVADASLTVAPAVHRYGWAWQDWNRLAGASVAGHVIECGAQATGGYFSSWPEIDFDNLGFPIAEIDEQGAAVITKPVGTGGAVNRRTVVSQLVYEIGDPSHYLTPDVDLDFTTVEVEELGNDRVAVRGATGRQAPESYKVSLAYHDGFATSGQLFVYGDDCVAKAQRSAETIFRKLEREGATPESKLIELLGAGEGVPALRAKHAPPEVMLRISVRDPRREVVERFTRQFAPLITGGPPGLAGYATARSDIRPVYAYWPCLIEKELVRGEVMSDE